MHLIVGLGNPGDKYRNNRHNIGFMAADAIASRHRFAPFRDKFKGFIAEGTIDGEKVLLLKPQTFMNDSGESVAAAATFYKLQPSDITVIYDELDLVPGKVRIKVDGGNGGHNGVAHAGRIHELVAGRAGAAAQVARPEPVGEHGVDRRHIGHRRRLRPRLVLVAGRTNDPPRVGSAPVASGLHR